MIMDMFVHSWRKTVTCQVSRRVSCMIIVCVCARAVICWWGPNQKAGRNFNRFNFLVTEINVQGYIYM